VREAFLRYTEVFPDMRGEVESVREAGKEVVALVRFHGLAAGSGVPIDHLWAYVCAVEDGRVSSFHAYWDPAEALEAAGLRE
jgi:ketosteroid isomerase-like protein